MGLLKKLFGKSARRKDAKKEKPTPVDSGLSGINPLAMSTSELERRLQRHTAQEVDAQWANDPWQKNYVMSVWEKAHGQTELNTYPWHQSMALLAACNADCVFCPKEQKPRGKLGMQMLHRLATSLRYAKTLTLTGGEPTLHLQFREFITEIGKCTDKRCSISMITNGSRLHEYIEECCKTITSFSVSINAASDQMHDRLMRLGPQALPKIMENIRYLREQGKHVNLGFVVVRENLHEIPAFLEMAQKLQVNTVCLRTLNPPTKFFKYIPDYEAMAPYQHPEFPKLFGAATRAIAECKLTVITDPKQWSVRLHAVPTAQLEAKQQFAEKLSSFQNTQGPGNGLSNTGRPLPSVLAGEDPELHDTGNPYQRCPPFACGYPFFSSQLITQEAHWEPCCFIQRVPGFDSVKFEASDDFFALRNSPAFVALRKSLKDGPLYPICKTCTVQMRD